jgi:hypothetical protein
MVYVCSSISQHLTIKKTCRMNFLFCFVEINQSESKIKLHYRWKKSIIIWNSLIVICIDSHRVTVKDKSYRDCTIAAMVVRKMLWILLQWLFRTRGVVTNRYDSSSLRMLQLRTLNLWSSRKNVLLPRWLFQNCRRHGHV